MNPVVSRRSFLGAAASGAVALTSPGRATASPGRYKETNRVDLHAHHLPPVYLDALHAQGVFAIGGIPIPPWTPELALEFMDGHGIAVQMLSISDPGVSFAPDAEAPGLARQCNDYLASVIAGSPRRFGGFAVLPMNDVDAARAEAARSLDQLELDGVGLLSSNNGRYLGDPSFEPLLADLDARRAWVFVHPTAIADDDRPSYEIPNFIAEYPFDTTRTIISLLFNGSFHRYPNIRWHFAHGGGTVPMLRFRLEALANAAKEFGPALGLPSGASVLTAKAPTWALHRAFFDTALIADRPALDAVAAMARVRRLLFGSDWPFASRLYGPTGDPQPTLSKVFDADARHRIDRLTARGQFPRLKSIVPG
jgi:predicted TIM-barrel fold metal-dependent hydrolase